MRDVLWLGAAFVVLVAQLTLVGGLLLRRHFLAKRRLNRYATTVTENRPVIGFFHPYCAAGGGGERVLWCAVRAVFDKVQNAKVVIFTGDTNVSPSDIIQQAQKRFGLELRDDAVDFVFLHRRWLVEASTWPRCTLLGQSLGSAYLAMEALPHCPDVVIDTMGYAFTYPVFVLLGACRMGTYTHYPTISTDMLERVRNRDTGVCNNEAVARSSLRSHVKLLYYHFFALLYSFVGRFAEVVLVNSSWTQAHINRLWNIPKRTHLLYPPCDTSALAALPIERAAPKAGGMLILSLAQFRPEKDHSAQLRAFSTFLKSAPQHGEQGTPDERVRLIVAGGCRDDGDWERLRALKALALELGLRERDDGASDPGDWNVAFWPNAPIEEVRTLLGQATVGLHTMRDEHFGISVVEFMAAGAIVLAHDSAGPKMDIVRPLDGQRTGFLASDDAGYAKALQDIFSMSVTERQEIAAAGRQAVQGRFSQEVFEKEFANYMLTALLDLERSSHGKCSKED